MFASIVLQNFFRMLLTKKKYSGLIKVQKSVLAEEKERLERLKRIKDQEKELAILRSMPFKDFYNFERLKKENSAK